MLVGVKVWSSEVLEWLLWGSRFFIFLKFIFRK